MDNDIILTDDEIEAFDMRGLRCEDISRTACPACDGLAHLMGVLGKRAHYRCEDCGVECSKAI